MARRLHRDEGHRLGLPLEPGIEGGEAGPALTDSQDLSIGARLTVAAASHRMAPSPDVDANRRPLGRLPSADPRGARSPRSTSADGSDQRSNAAGSRSPFRAGGRGPDTSSNGHLPDSWAPVSPWKSP